MHSIVEAACIIALRRNRMSKVSTRAIRVSYGYCKVAMASIVHECTGQDTAKPMGTRTPENIRC